MRRTLLLFVVLFAWPIVASAQSPIASDAVPIASLEIPATLTALRSEADEDRVTATALLTHARLLQQRRDPLAALRRFQRAYRYNPQPGTLKQIVELAIALGRTHEAARYAALAPESLIDTLQLRRLALEATSRRDFPLAAQLYEASLKSPEAAGSKSAMLVLMRAELGRLQYLTKQYEPAAQSFAQVREALSKPEEYELSESIQKVIVGDRRDTYTLMARAALEAKQYGDALELFREAHHDQPESSAAQLDLARVALARDDPAAESLIKKVLETPSDSSGAALELLRLQLSRKNSNNVEEVQGEVLVGLVKQHPAHEAYRRELATCWIKLGKLAEAESLLTDASLEQPSDELKLQLAAVYRQQKSAQKWLDVLAGLVTAHDLAIAEFESKALADDEVFAKATLDLARAAPSETAIDKARHAIAALVATARQQWDDADRFFQASLSTEPASRGRQLLQWGRRLKQADQYQRSTVALQQAIEANLSPIELAPAYFYLSGAAALADQPQVALEAARNAVKQRPDDIRFLAREAWVLHYAQQGAAARKKYQALLARFARQTDGEFRNELRDARLVLSVISLELGDAAVACEYLEEVLDEFPHDISAMNDLGYLWADRGWHLQRSLRMAQTAVASQPENRAYRDSLGWIFFRLGRHPEAIQELQLAVGGKRSSGLILQHLGDALAAAGRADEARTAWRQALEAYGRDGDLTSAATIEKKLSP